MQQRGIAILGGTFDPIHHGHLTIAQWINDNLPYRQVQLIPCYHPLLGKQPVASVEQRLHMVEIAVADYSQLTVNRCEIERQDNSYTADTLQQLRIEHPNEPLLCAMGSDAFLTLANWHHWQQIIQLAQLLVIRRPQDSLTDIANMGEQLQLPYLEVDDNTQTAGTFMIADCEPIDLSSTAIRAMLQQGKPCSAIPPAVMEFIVQQQLYGVTDNTEPKSHDN